MEKVHDDLIHFRCAACKIDFDAVPGDTVPTEHPSCPDYYAACPQCGGRAPEYWRMRNLRRSYARVNGKKPGPATEAGRAVALSNLSPPDAAGIARLKIAALRHGMYARTAQWYPAIPGSRWCGHCDVDPAYCRKQPACLKQTELFMRHKIAFDTRDPGLFRELRAETTANVQAIINMMIGDIVSRGVTLSKPDWFVGEGGAVTFVDDPTGDSRFVQQFYAHPLLKHLTDMLQKMGMSLTDEGMTVKQQEEDATMRGHIEEEQAGRDTLLGFQQQQAENLARLSELFARSRERVKTDPVLVGYQEGEEDA